MKGFGFPRRADVTPANQFLFDRLSSLLGVVPNLYAGFAWSENALSTYLALENSSSSLNARQREAIHLMVSQLNECDYCIAAHSQIAQMNGFTAAEVDEIRLGTAGFNQVLDAMIRLAKNIAENRGACDEHLLNTFYNAGLTKENLVDIIVLIGQTIIANYLQTLIRAPIDFPLMTDWELSATHREG